jgi:hypothetical protein
MKQMIDNRDMVDKLNDLNHDYQRMRKMGRKRINKNLTKFNKDRAKEEKEIRDRLGVEAWVDLKRISILEASAWVAVGLLLGFWLGAR